MEMKIVNKTVFNPTDDILQIVIFLLKTVEKILFEVL